MTDIDTQVAEFARELDGAAVLDLDQIAADVDALARDILEAKTDEAAAIALREFMDQRPDDVDYARAVVVGTVQALGFYVIAGAPMDRMDTILARVKRIAYAVRGLGIAQWFSPLGGVL